MKTYPKTKIFQKFLSILKGFIFIKTFIKCINEGLIPVYIDETNFQINNNNLKVWRLKNKFLFFNIGKSDRRNLILAVTPNKTLHYEINKRTNKSKDFLKFFDSLLKKISKNHLKNHLFIMDNCSIHLNKEHLEFFF